MSERIHSDLPQFNVFIQHRLKKMVAEFNGTRAEFAEKASISTSSLTRYLNGHCTLRSTVAKNMLAFVSKNRNEYLELLAHYFSKEAKTWKRVYADTDTEVVQPKVLDYIEKKPVYYHVYSHSGLDYGMPLATVEKSWGKAGMKLAQHLIDDELLDLEEKRVVRKNKSATYGSLDTVKQAAIWVVDEFPLENIYKEEGGLSVMLDNLNEEGVAEMRKQYLKHCAEVAEILTNPKFKGTIPYSYCVVTGKTPCSEDYQKDVQEIIEDEEKKNEK